jgi:hypothetical protein
MRELIDLGKKTAKDFLNAKDQVAYLKAVAVLDVPKKNLLSCYYIFCRDKSIPLIEDLSDDDKQKTWETAKEIADGRVATVEEMKDLCRCLVALEFLLTM